MEGSGSKNVDSIIDRHETNTVRLIFVGFAASLDDTIMKRHKQCIRHGTGAIE